MSGKLVIRPMNNMSRANIDKMAAVLVTGCDGFVGAAIAKQLEREGYQHIITDVDIDLRNQSSVHVFFEREKPEYVFLSLPKNIGSSLYKYNKADFIQDQLMMQTNVMHASHLYGVKKCLFVGSPYVYPPSLAQPLKESDMLSARMDSFHESFGLVDILGVKMSQAYHFQYETSYLSVIPTHIYGPGMPTEGIEKHTLPFLWQQILAAKKQNKNVLTLPGSANDVNEFLYIEDFANACLFLMEQSIGGEMVNVGSGFIASKKLLAKWIAEELGYDGKISFDVSSKRGVACLMLDSSKLNILGWKAKISLKTGIHQMIADDSIF